MPVEYYFDLETTTVMPSQGKIISIQLQRLEEGTPVGEFKILSEWECGSEYNLLKEFMRNVIIRKFEKRMKWTVPHSNETLIPVGDNLRFEFMWLQRRMAYHKIFRFYSPEDFYNLKHIDLKTLLILMKAGFSGHTDFLKEDMDIQGADIPQLYAEGRFEDIEYYVKEEKDRLCEFYSIIKEGLPAFKQDILHRLSWVKSLPLGTAERIAGAVLNVISPCCEKTAVVGSIRRKREFVRDVDLVAIPTGGMFEIADAVQGMKRFKGITRKGEKNMTFYFLSVKVNIFLADHKTWAITKLQRTGSREFNIYMYSMAKEKGIDLHELEAETEEDIFRALNIKFIAAIER